MKKNFVFLKFFLILFFLNNSNFFGERIKGTSPVEIRYRKTETIEDVELKQNSGFYQSKIKNFDKNSEEKATAEIESELDISRKEKQLNEEQKVPKKKLSYQNEGKYYLYKDLKILDKRSTGSLYPNVFNVVHTEQNFNYVKNESPESGCILEDLFLEDIYPEFGFDLRRFLNAISQFSCEDLSNKAERKTCLKFKNNKNCSSSKVKPLVFLLFPLEKAGKNSSYLTYSSGQSKLSCKELKDVLLSETFVPEGSQEWQKIRRDLIEKEKKRYKEEKLKNSVPKAKIKELLLEENPQATQRDLDFAINDWIYERVSSYEPPIKYLEIKALAENRFSPAAAVKSLVQFAEKINYSCQGKKQEYNTRAYGEAFNISADRVFEYVDYLEKKNKCICKKSEF